MSAATAEKKKWTVEEYLERERQATEKHEFFGGEIFAMAGASPEHNRVVANLITALSNIAGDRCDVYPSDQRLFLAATGLYTYADVSVVCSSPDFTDDEPRALRNPEQIFEVLSESTEKYDRGGKFENYRTLTSLTDYVLLSQSKILVEHFSRQPDGSWNLRELRAGQALHLPCGEITIDALYRRVLPGNAAV